MVIQKSRIAPPSEAQAVRRQRGRRPLRPAQAALRHVAVAVLLAGAVYALPKLFGPDFFHDRIVGAMAFGAAAGDWVRTALAIAFESIPVR